MDNVIQASERNGKPKSIRRSGFIPAVLNGPGTASSAIQVKAVDLNKIIADHGTSAKLWIDRNGEKKFGYIKNIQRDPVGGKILHVSIQLLSSEQDTKMTLPITFRGHAELEHNLLQLQICKPDIEVEGKAALIPDEASVDVSEKKSGENITAADFHLPAEIKILDAENEVYAMVKPVKVTAEEEPKEDQPEEPSA